MPKTMTCALLISTYNWPEALKLVLESVTRQTRIPDEVVIADDGSGEATRTLIEKVRQNFPCPLIHVWHEDDGFRKCIIWNKAISRCSCDYIVQIDGDCVLAPRFIEDHLTVARDGWFTCGSRTLLTRERTEEVLSAGTANLHPLSRGVQNTFNALRIPPRTVFFRERYRAHKPYISKGCNMGFWKKDLVAVNG
ncbi:MAG: glycosyltransferase family 2 protein, partial [Opitutales bacterium]|nr:glycosyltransferase family 2 protein [Opitutales bacterium]